MLILGFAAAIYIYFLFLGFRFARLMLPPALIPYRMWLAPWLGLSIAAVLLVSFSRLGADIANAIYPRTIVGAAFAGWSVLLGHRSPLDRNNPRLHVVAASLITLLLALYPLLIISNVPTTISLSNHDATGTPQRLTSLGMEA
jgi:hypothetical protein